VSSAVSPGSIRSIVWVFSTGGDCWIVSVTSIETSWLSPVFSTATTKARSVEATIGVSVVPGESCWPLGCTVTDWMLVP
jgi:hypothetical protein